MNHADLSFRVLRAHFSSLARLALDELAAWSRGLLVLALILGPPNVRWVALSVIVGVLAAQVARRLLTGVLQAKLAERVGLDRAGSDGGAP